MWLGSATSTLRLCVDYAIAPRPDMNVQATVRRRLKLAFSPIYGALSCSRGIYPPARRVHTSRLDAYEAYAVHTKPVLVRGTHPTEQSELEEF